MSDINFQEELTNKLSKICSLVPVGTPWMGFDIKSKPFGVQLYQGQILSRTLYPVHFSWVETHKTIVTEDEWNTYANSHNGMCPYFSYGDGVETYRMPKIIDVYPRFGNSSEAGEYREAGLPNITGSHSTSRYSGWEISGTGAFTLSNSVTRNTMFDDGSNSTLPFYVAMFDASYSNPIYGNSDTVQPPTVNMLLGEYVFSDVGEVSQATEDIVISTIEKIEQLENLQSAYVKKSDVSSYVVKTWSSGTEWYRKWSDGWIEQGGFVNYGSSWRTVTLLLPFSSVYYTLSGSTHEVDRSYTGNAFGFVSKDKTTNTFLGGIHDDTSINAGSFTWYACGY